MLKFGYDLGWGVRMKIQVLRLIGGGAFALVLSVFIAKGQSVESTKPFPITSNEVSGEIAVRDIGDSRSTTYYYYFDGNRGDIFINVKTHNFSGDIDIYEAETLKPRTKMVIYADEDEYETGRIVYQRKPSRLILRIQGKAYLDMPAKFLIKFAGSFGAIDSALAENIEAPPTVTETEIEGVKVNSVGTIIEPPEEDIVAAVVDEKDVDGEERKTVIVGEKNEQKTAVVIGKFDPRRDPLDVETESKPQKDLESLFERKVIVVGAAPKEESSSETEELTVLVDDKPKKSSTIVSIEIDNEETEASNSTESEETEARVNEKLRNTNLVVQLSDGNTDTFRMDKVSSFNIFEGVLKVVEIDGKVTNYSILNIDKVSIEPR